MKLFKCQHCSQVLYYENVRCEQCAHRLGYLPAENTLVTLEPNGNDWTPITRPEQSYRFCVNAAHEVCNWLVAADTTDRFCLACRHNRTIPDLSIAANLAPWQRLETAKHRLFYTLLRLGLPLTTRAEDPGHGLAFDFLADTPAASGPKVMTGHDDGVITLALIEADDAEREKRRIQMGEPYRTLLGHFRHEVGHHFWDILVRNGGRLDQCRVLFGDDTEDYNAALQRHYASGAPADWQERFISAYASSHPWEDFAETWAHYLHIVDTVEMAGAFGVRVDPKVDADENLTAVIDFDPHATGNFDRLIGSWLPLTFAMNSLNRCMGDRRPLPVHPLRHR